MNVGECPVWPPIGPSLATTCGGSAYLIFMGLLEGFLRTQSDLEDPCGRPVSRITPDLEYDFIVVGSGSGGSVVASRLSEVPNFKVLLIEAGDNEPVGSQVPSLSLNYIGSEMNYLYYSEPEKNACLLAPEQRCFWPRGKVLGGTSVINRMEYNRGNREDFDKWEAMGNPGWKYDDVLPYFLKSEDYRQIDEVDQTYHKTGGLLPVSTFQFQKPFAYSILKAGEELGYLVQDLNGANSTGFMFSQTTSKNGVRYSTARAFLRPVHNRPNLHILLNTTVSKILWHPNTNRASGVEIIDKLGKISQISVRKEVIVSGGTINSPQILLLSGIGPKEELIKLGVRPVIDLPGVGKNLHSHIAYTLNFYINETYTSPLNWATATEYLLFRDGPLSGIGLSLIAKMATKFSESPTDPDLQLYFRGYIAYCSMTGQVGELEEQGPRVIYIAPAALRPRSRGYVTLHSNDPLAAPKIVANYLTEEHDIQVILEGIKFLLRLAETKALQAYGLRLDTTVVKGCESFKFGSDAYWICAIKQNTRSDNHLVSTCKMGPRKDRLAVVDHELKVHGVHNVRVIDASIMPAVTSGNTMAPVIMIGEKGADHILRSWGAA